MLLADDWLVGLLKGLFRPEQKESPLDTANRHLRQSARIWRGLFIGKPRTILSRLSWEILQTLLGFAAAHLANWCRPVKSVKYLNYITVLEGGGVGGSISFGTYMLIYPGYSLNERSMLFMHEYGHSLQSRASGPLYLFKYGIPSLFTDNYSWMEEEANLRAALYFQKHSAIPPEVWQQSRFGRLAKEMVNPKWWEYLLLALGVGVVLVPLLNIKRGI